MSGNTTKKRKIKTITDIFTSNGNPITNIGNIEILEFFERTLFPTSISNIGVYPKRLVRLGGTHENLNLSLRVSSDGRGRGSVCPIHIPEFSQTALTEIENYRIIYKTCADGIYRVIENFSRNPGTYLIAYAGEPQFKIEISPTPYVAGQMTFKQCEGISTFECMHELDKRPRKFTIKTCVPQRTKGDKEKLVKKLLQDFHKGLGQKYIELGMTSAEE